MSKYVEIALFAQINKIQQVKPYRKLNVPKTSFRFLAYEVKTRDAASGIALTIVQKRRPYFVTIQLPMIASRCIKHIGTEPIHAETN